MSLCPICGRTIGTYTNDPVFATPTLSTSQYQGFTQLLAQHIKEIQDERHQQELDNGVTPLTEFSPINIINLFQNIKQYILELRSSTEKILNAVGMSLHDFLSNDEDGNIISSKDDWSDPNLEEIKYQCKAIHIEDLRHYIQSMWIEKFNITPEQTYYETIETIFFPVSQNWIHHDFVGDKGFWRTTEAWHFSKNSGWQIQVEGILDYTNSAKSILDITGLSTKFELKANMDAIATLITPPDMGATLSLTPALRFMDNTGFKLKNTTHCSFDFTLNLTESGTAYSRQARIHIHIVFSSGYGLVYSYGFGLEVWSNPINLSYLEITNFDRNIYTDYINAGFPYSDGITIACFTLYADNYIHLTGGHLHHTIVNESIIDNIKFFQGSI